MSDEKTLMDAEFRLGSFLVRPSQNVIVNIADQSAEIRLEPKVMGVLVHLAEQSGEVISRDELMDAVWSDVVVSDETVTRCISELRNALGDSTKSPQYIQTIPKKGYRLLEEPTTATAEPQAPPLPASSPGATQSSNFKTPVILLVLVLIGLGAAALFMGQDENQPSDTIISVEVSPATPSIAVLPFVNMSDIAENEYFSDGMTEELLNTLARGKELRVIGRTSAFQFKGKNEDLRDIGRKLNVTHILEGSVRRAGDTVRVTAQLVDTTDGVHLWSETFDRTLDDVFAVQDEIADAVSASLQVELLGPDLTPHNGEAYDWYLKGLRAQRLPGPESMRQATEFYERAVELDPTLAVAWEHLARSYANMTTAALVPISEGVQKAKDAVQRAIELDPNLPGAHNAWGSILATFDLDWVGANAAYERALAIDPNHGRTLNSASFMAAAMGNDKLALEYITRSIRADPLNLGGLHNKAFVQYLGRDYAGAEASIHDAIAFAGGNYSFAHTILSLILIAQGRFDEALVASQKELGEPFRLSAESVIHHALGNQAESDAALEQLVAKYADLIAVPISGNFAYRGELETSMEWLNRAYEQGDPQLLTTAVHPMNDNLRGYPPYEALLKKLGLTY